MKDDSVSDGDDCGWLDQVAFIPDIVAPPTLTAARFVAGQFRCEVGGSTGVGYVVIGSSNLVDWVPLQTNTAPFTFTDPGLLQSQVRFFRARASTP